MFFFFFFFLRNNNLHICLPIMCLLLRMVGTFYIRVAKELTQILLGPYSNFLHSVIPTDIMKEQAGARTIISVDVSAELQKNYYEYGTHLSGWWLLINSWNPFTKTVNVPSMGDIQDALRWVSSDQHRRRMESVADLHLRPPIQDFGTLDFDKFDEIVERGYAYAKPLVDELVRKNPSLVSVSPRKMKDD